MIRNPRPGDLVNILGFRGKIPAVVVKEDETGWWWILIGTDEGLTIWPAEEMERVNED